MGAALRLQVGEVCHAGADRSGCQWKKQRRRRRQRRWRCLLGHAKRHDLGAGAGLALGGASLHHGAGAGLAAAALGRHAQLGLYAFKVQTRLGMVADVPVGDAAADANNHDVTIRLGFSAASINENVSHLQKRTVFGFLVMRRYSAQQLWPSLGECATATQGHGHFKFVAQPPDHLRHAQRAAVRQAVQQRPAHQDG